MKTLKFDVVDEDFYKNFERKENIFTLKNKDMCKVITPKRMEIINTLKYLGGAYQSDLAKRLKRKKQAISRDVKLLRKAGIIERSNHGGNYHYVPFDSIKIKLNTKRKIYQNVGVTTNNKVFGIA